MAFSFTNDYFDLSSNPQPSANAAFTWHIWAIPAQTNANDSLMGILYNSERISLGIRSTSATAFEGIEDGEASFECVGPTYDASTWQSFCGTYDGIDEWICYRNGVAGTPETSTAQPVDIELGVFQVGESPGFSNFSGLIAEPLVLNVRLSPTDVLALYRYSPKLVSPGNINYYSEYRDNTNPVFSSITSAGTGPPVVDADHPIIIQPTAQILQFPSIAALSQNQDQFGFYNDDGNEASATIIGAQNVNLTQVKTTPAILRIQVNNTGDLPTQQLKIQCKKTSDPDSAYADVPVA